MIIETANKTLDQEYVRTHPHGKAGEFVMVSVSDTGVGMSEEVIERASEPFFTTKEQGKGTGLGLSMVYGFVQRSGGHIHIFSKLGEGTTLCLFLPRATSSVEDVDSSIEAGTLPNGTETVLVVDDEEALRDIAVSYLEGLGYKTYSAVDAAQALAILKGRTDIDLLFSDVIMPGENDGFQLASIAHLDNPSIKILMTSGFTNKSEEHVDSDDEFLVRLTSDLLRKPYNQSELAIAVRRQLDRG